MVEVVVSTMIVGVMMVVALNTLGGATRSGMSAGNRAVALGLADERMSKILQTSYDQLDGLAATEQLTGDRANWRRITKVTNGVFGNGNYPEKQIVVEIEYYDQANNKWSDPPLVKQRAIRTDTD